MSRPFKKAASFLLAVMMLVCVVTPISVGASSLPYYTLSAYTEGGGQIIQGKAVYAPGELVTVRAIPFEGYTFFCWMSDDVVFVSQSSDLTQFLMPAADVKITAVFAIAQNVEQSTVNITFDTMGGSDFSPVEISVGAMCPEPSTVPTKQGYVFDGWYADAICTMPFDFTTPIYTSTFVYAKWSPVVVEEPEANTFSDVKSGDWFYNHVMSLAEKNVISGMGKDANGVAYFAPKANITRAQFVTILLNIAGENLYKDTDIAAIFDDVKNDAWYADAVAWAYSMGVAKGTGDRRFNPESFITRQDMAVMISNYTANVAKKTLSDSVEKMTFADGADIAQYASSAVETMQRAGIISGRTGNVFAPRANATRAETCKMIDVLLSLI